MTYIDVPADLGVPLHHWGERTAWGLANPARTRTDGSRQMWILTTKLHLVARARYLCFDCKMLFSSHRDASHMTEPTD